MSPFIKAALAASLLCAALNAQAAEIRIGAGQASGEYTTTVVPAINAALEKAGDGMSAVPVVSAGSQDNLERLISGELDAALVQLDVLALNPTDQVELIELIAPEALLCAARADGSIRSYYNLTDDRAEPMVLSVGPEGSGSAATLSYVLSLDPDFNVENVAIVNESNTEAELDRLAAGTRDLVCMMMLANPDNALIAKVNDSDELRFIDFVDAYALEAAVGDVNVYESAVVPVSKGLWGFRANKIQTLSTWMALVVRSDTPAEIVDALRTAVATPDLLPPTTAVGKAKAMYSQFKERAKDVSLKAKDKAIEWKNAAQERALTLKDRAVELGGQAKDKAVELGSKAVDKASELKDKAVEKASGLKDRATDAVPDSNN